MRLGKHIAERCAQGPREDKRYPKSKVLDSLVKKCAAATSNNARENTWPLLHSRTGIRQPIA